MPRRPTAHDDDTAHDHGTAPADLVTPTRTAAGESLPLPGNVRLLRGRGPNGRVGPIGQTDIAETEAVQLIVEAAQTPIEAYRQQLFRSARIVHDGTSIVDWWHAGQARRAIDAACIQFARLAPTAQRRVLASLPRQRPRLVEALAASREGAPARP